jgi:hypothetical protein
LAGKNLEHLIEELEDIGKSNHRELDSPLVVLLAHLLKWGFQLNQLQGQWREFDGRSWRKTSIERRVQIERLLEDRPSLSSHFETILQQAYPTALKLACKETQLDSLFFPSECPYSPKQLLNEDFMPESR